MVQFGLVDLVHIYGLDLFQVFGQLEFPFTVGVLTFNKVDVPDLVKVARREKRISVFFI